MEEEISVLLIVSWIVTYAYTHMHTHTHTIHVVT